MKELSWLQYLYLQELLELGQKNSNPYMMHSSAIKRIEKIIIEREYTESDAAWLNGMKKTYLKYKK